MGKGILGHGSRGPRAWHMGGQAERRGRPLQRINEAGLGMGLEVGLQERLHPVLGRNYRPEV